MDFVYLISAFRSHSSSVLASISYQLVIFRFLLSLCSASLPYGRNSSQNSGQSEEESREMLRFREKIDVMLHSNRLGLGFWNAAHTTNYFSAQCILILAFCYLKKIQSYVPEDTREAPREAAAVELPISRHWHGCVRLRRQNQGDHLIWSWTGYFASMMHLSRDSMRCLLYWWLTCRLKQEYRIVYPEVL